MNSPRHPLSALLLCGLLLLIPNAPTHAGSATWKTNPVTSDWNTASNWQPATVPNGPNDTATFDASGGAVTFSNDIEINSIVFATGAAPYTTTTTPTNTLTISGTGITNNSGANQSFVADQDESGGTNGINFENSATAGGATSFTLVGGQTADFGSGGAMTFFDSSSADHATIDVFGAKQNAFKAAALTFYGSSTAADSTLTLHAGTGGYGAAIYFSDESTAANAVIDNQGGYIVFQNSATAANSIITLTGSRYSNQAYYTASLDFKGTSADHAMITSNGGQFSGDPSYGFINFEGGHAASSIVTTNGGVGAGAPGAFTIFTGTLATADNATLIANGGTNGGGGGLIQFQDGSDGGAARLEVFGNGSLDLSVHDAPGITIGSLEGDGLVFLGANALTFGSNNFSTTFSGVISDSGPGSLVKTGNGKFTLSGANTYTGGTTINAGTLLITNRRGSGTGSGPVQINGGKLGGTGKIGSNVIVGDGSGPEAFLTPGTTNAIPATLTIQKKLTFLADGTDHFGYKSNNVTADKVVASGVTIGSGALLFFGPIDTGVLPIGTVFTAIDNRGARPIAGTFANIADGATVTVGSNTFQASYEGGDGNDLTLTVVP